MEKIAAKRHLKRHFAAILFYFQVIVLKIVSQASLLPDTTHRKQAEHDQGAHQFCHLKGLGSIGDEVAKSCFGA